MVNFLTHELWLGKFYFQWFYGKGNGKFFGRHLLFVSDLSKNGDKWWRFK